MTPDVIARHVYKAHFAFTDYSKREADLAELFTEYILTPELSASWFEAELDYMWMQ